MRGEGSIYGAYQDLDHKIFDPIYDVRIANNSISNRSRHWLSYITAVFVNGDARAFGTAMLGIEIRGNRLLANRLNLSSRNEEYAGSEGYVSMMRVEDYDRYEAMPAARVLGTIFQDNWCINCLVAYRIGTGAAGTVISGAQSPKAGKLFDNWKTTASRSWRQAR